jgi:hypothetical protein
MDKPPCSVELSTNSESIAPFFYDDLASPLNPDSLLAATRSLVTLFGIGIDKKRFYTFMASSTLPWQKHWQTAW